MNETMLAYVKLTLRIKTDAYDDEISNLISSALLDLGIAGVIIPENLDSILKQAVATYVKMNFGSLMEYERRQLKESYDEQKAQLSMCSSYTDFEVTNG